MRSSKLKLLCIVILLISSFSTHAVNELSWGSIAKVNVNELANRAKSFLTNEAPELKNTRIKLLEVSAGYREGQKRLFVSFYHDQSYREGSEEIMKYQANGGEIERTFITFDIVVVKFDGSGQPESKEIFGQKFPGTKEQFKKQFNEQDKH